MMFFLKNKKNQIFTIGLSIIGLILIIVFVRYIFKKENNETALSNHRPKEVTFFDIGETTELSSDVRDRLRDTLGPDAVETWNTLNLGLNYEGFLKKYFPELSQF